MKFSDVERYKGSHTREGDAEEREVRAMECPWPVRPPSERDIALAAAGDRMAKARIGVNKSRAKKREIEIAKWEAENGAAPWRSYPPDFLAVAGTARMVSPRGKNIRYVLVALPPTILVCPRGYALARVGNACR